MKLLVAKLRRYWRYYQAVVRYSLKGMMAYRLDFFLRFLFIICYFILSIGFLAVVFSKVNSILGWTRQEAYLFMAVYQLIWSIGYIFFFQCLRDVSWDLVRTGNLDFILLRPLNSRFQLSFSKPSFNDLISLIPSLFLFYWVLGQLHLALKFWNILFFLTAFLLAEIIYYLFAFIIASLSLFSNRTGHMLEFFDKAVEFSQYPTDIFSGKLYFMFFTIIPLALISFVPSRFLLGKAPLWLLAVPFILSLLLYLVSRYLFGIGLKHYSSASS